MLVPRPQELLNIDIDLIPDVKFYDVCISPKFCVFLGYKSKK